MSKLNHPNAYTLSDNHRIISYSPMNREKCPACYWVSLHLTAPYACLLPLWLGLFTGLSDNPAVLWTDQASWEWINNESVLRTLGSWCRKLQEVTGHWWNRCCSLCLLGTMRRTIACDHCSMKDTMWGQKHQGAAMIPEKVSILSLQVFVQDTASALQSLFPSIP